PKAVLMALEELRHAIAGQREELARLDGRLQDTIERLSAESEAAFTGLPPCTVPATEHRRKHRSGRPSKLDTDPELRAFVLARLDRLTFAEIAEEIAAHFPENRRVGRSSVHGWWKKNKT
ncbi:MAG: hypothetical protein ACPGNV_03590, partial [Mangrovicoccus sp.]